MLTIRNFFHVFLVSLLSLSLAEKVNANNTASLTVIVNGINNQKGEICMGVYSKAQGFPMNTDKVLKSACVQPTGSTLTHTFSVLKPGSYAVAVIDDQNGDRKLNTDFFGIPKEGFGISQNPTVSIATGTPSFYDASFFIKQSKTINIDMKYSLDS